MTPVGQQSATFVEADLGLAFQFSTTKLSRHVSDDPVYADLFGESIHLVLKKTFLSVKTALLLIYTRATPDCEKRRR